MNVKLWLQCPIVRVLIELLLPIDTDTGGSEDSIGAVVTWQGGADQRPILRIIVEVQI